MTTALDAPLVHDELLGVDVPPDKLVTRMIAGTMLSRVIYTACTLRVFDACAEAPATVADLAGVCGADADALGRYLRVLAASGLLEEDDAGLFHLTDLGSVLRHDRPASLAPCAVLISELIEPTAAAALYAARTGNTAFAHTPGCGLYEYLAGHPELEALFAAGMSSRAARLHGAVIAAVDWTGVGHIVDVGGNHGAFLAAVLAHLPAATGVLFDQPQVVAGAGPALTEAGVADRVDVEAGDFFVAVPPGGDLYLVANVLWNWADTDALRILSRCRDAMAPAARLLICEPVVPTGNAPHPAKNLDVGNFWLNGGRTRRPGEWDTLLRNAGFELSSITETPEEWSVIEAR